MRKTTKKNKLQLTTRGRYAVMAMIELAQRKDGSPVPLSEIAEAGDISLSYLEQLFAGLRRNGLVRSYRGPGGGYILAKNPADIKIADIMYSAEDSVPGRRISNSNLGATRNIKAVALWSQIGEILDACMSKVSLADVIGENLDEHPEINKVFATLK